MCFSPNLHLVLKCNLYPHMLIQIINDLLLSSVFTPQPQLWCKHRGSMYCAASMYCAVPNLNFSYRVSLKVHLILSLYRCVAELHINGVY